MKNWRSNNYFILVVFMSLNILVFVAVSYMCLGSTLQFTSWVTMHWLTLLAWYVAMVSMLVLGNLVHPRFKEFFAFWDSPGANTVPYAEIGYRPENCSSNSASLAQHHPLFLTQEIAWLSCVFLVFLGLGVLTHKEFDTWQFIYVAGLLVQYLLASKKARGRATSLTLIKLAVPVGSTRAPARAED